MIQDFFHSKIFPKFYLKTASSEVFALGKSATKTSDLVGMVPIDLCKHFPFEQELYTPQSLEVFPSKISQTPLIAFTQQPIDYCHDLTLKAWEDRVNRSQKKFQESSLSKVVLKRETRFTFKIKVDPLSFFLTFQNKNPLVNHFFIQPNENMFFFGGTPEHLFERKNSSLKTMALASTISSKLPPSFLTENQKFIQEFNIVKNQIHSLLSPLCNELNCNNTLVKTFGPLRHLFAEIEGRLKEVDDRKLIDLLHPTAAIIGYPQVEAKNFVTSIETSPRTLYASCLGFSTPKQSEMVVGIRSGLILENLLHAFAGVGIVEESDPKSEWKELNLKLKPIKIWV
jgi:menaquinone-specific isochorismate synthase